MSYNLHELYAARTNLKLGVSASTRKMKPLPLNVPNFWEGELGMMEHVLQKFPEPNRFIDESVVIPSTLDTRTLAGVTQGKSHEPTVLGKQSEQVYSTNPVMKNTTIQTDDTVSLFNYSGTQKDDIEFRSLKPSQGENMQDGKINSVPLTKSQGKETQDHSMNSVSYIVISDDEDSVIEIDVHVNEEGHLKNDRRKEKRCNTKKTVGAENNLNQQSVSENKHPRNSEHIDKQKRDTLSHGGKLFSCKQNIKRFDTFKDADATREVSRIRSGSSDVCQSSSNITDRGIVLSSLHHSLDFHQQPSTEVRGDNLIREIKENKAKLKILSKKLKLSKTWVESVDYVQFTSYHSWIKEVEIKIQDKLQLTTGLKSKNRLARTVHDEGEQWLTAKRALLDFKNMYETIRKNRLDLFPNP